MIYDKFFFVLINILITLLLISVYFFSKNKFKFILFFILFFSLQSYNIYFLIINSERITYSKLRYDTTINKSSFSELNCDLKYVDLCVKNSIKNLGKSNSIVSFYNSILNQSYFIENKYFPKKNTFSRIASIVILTSNLYPFASEKAVFFQGNGVCIDNLPPKYLIDKLKTAKYACCGDYCYITAKVLNLAGIKSRYIFTKQHLLLEVYCDKKWILIDPTFGIVYDQNYFFSKNYNILLLPNFGLNNNSNNYRNSFFVIRNYMINMSLNATLKNSLYKSTLDYSTFEKKYLLQ